MSEKKRFKLKKGDNGFYLIFDKNKFFLALKHKDEARIVVDYLNLNEIGFSYMQQKLFEQEKIIHEYKRKVWKLRQQLKENNINEDFE